MKERCTARMTRNSSDNAVDGADDGDGDGDGECADIDVNDDDDPTADADADDDEAADEADDDDNATFRFLVACNDASLPEIVNESNVVGGGGGIGIARSASNGASMPPSAVTMLTTA